MEDYYTKLDWDRFVRQAHPLLRRWYAAELRLAGKLRAKRALEVGCGSGRFLGTLARRCEEVVGLDNSPHMVRLARQRLRSRKNVKVVYADASALPFADESFDVVACVGNTFGNLGRLKRRVLGEMIRVCRRGGKILVSVYSERALRARLESYGRDELTHVRITRSGTVYSREGLFSEQFTAERLKKIFHRSALRCTVRRLTPAGYLVEARKLE